MAERLSNRCRRFRAAVSLRRSPRGAPAPAADRALQRCRHGPVPEVHCCSSRSQSGEHRRGHCVAHGRTSTDPADRNEILHGARQFRPRRPGLRAAGRPGFPAVGGQGHLVSGRISPAFARTRDLCRLQRAWDWSVIGDRAASGPTTAPMRSCHTTARPKRRNTSETAARSRTAATMRGPTGYGQGHDSDDRQFRTADQLCSAVGHRPLRFPLPLLHGASG